MRGYLRRKLLGGEWMPYVPSRRLRYCKRSSTTLRGDDYLLSETFRSCRRLPFQNAAIVELSTFQKFSWDCRASHTNYHSRKLQRFWYCKGCLEIAWPPTSLQLQAACSSYDNSRLVRCSREGNSLCPDLLRYAILARSTVIAALGESCSASGIHSDRFSLRTP